MGDRDAPVTPPLSHSLNFCPSAQNSFYKLMMGDNKSEKFFKVFHDRMKEAQTDIKATVSVNVGEVTNKATEKQLDGGESQQSIVPALNPKDPLNPKESLRPC